MQGALGGRGWVRTPSAALVMAALLVVGASTPATAATNDRYIDKQWALFQVGADRAWATGQGEGIVIAVVDTGVDLQHEDLKGTLVAGRDFVDGTSAQDQHGHGTYVAGIAAAVANNGLGIAGVAPRARIMPVRALDKDGRGDTGGIDAAVRWAVDNGAHVVNLSLSAGAIVELISGGSLTSTVNYAWSKGVIPVVSAGNDGLFRRDRTNALIVTATNRSGGAASYAPDVRLAKWGIGAPGGESGPPDSPDSMVLSTWWSPGDRSKHTDKHKYAYAAGTSVSAPHVAAAAAVLRGLGLSPQETVDRLLSTARDVGQRSMGAGRLDLAAAVAGLSPASPVRTTSEEPPSQIEEPAPTAGPEPQATAPVATATPAAAEESTPQPVVATPEPTPGPLSDEDVAAFQPPLDSEPPAAQPPVLAVAAVGSVLAATVAGWWATYRRRMLMRGL